ncbi:hypothetical protein BC828DRAFT_396009 [Blastocladiella britannica]|nr:hypothetical protein BC828DRAFT_396009 [Blastocladiella britannica]
MVRFTYVNHFLIAVVACILFVDHVIVYFGAPRFLSTSLATAGMTFIAGHFMRVLADVYSKNAVRIVLRGTDEAGLITQMSMASLMESPTRITIRTLKEIYARGWRQVDPLRKTLVATVFFGWLVVNLWTIFAATMVTDRLWNVIVQRKWDVPHLNPANIFGLSKCSDALEAGNITFSFTDGPSGPLGSLLNSVYGAFTVNTSLAIRRATAQTLSDYLHVDIDGTRYAVAVPTAPRPFAVYNTTLVGVNVTCGVKAGAKSGPPRQFASNVAASALFPGAFSWMPLAPWAVIADTIVVVPRGFPMISSLSSTAIDIAKSTPSNLCNPLCNRGVCLAFSNDTYYGLRCAMRAVSFNATVTKLKPFLLTDTEIDEALTSATSPGTDPDDDPQVTLAIRNVKPLPVASTFMANALTGWPTPLHWSWIARAYRFEQIPDSYVLNATETTLALDAQALLAYAALTLATTPHKYSLSVSAQSGTAGCLDVTTDGATAKVTIDVVTPALLHSPNSTIFEARVLTQTSYRWQAAVLCTLAVTLYLSLLCPVVQCTGPRSCFARQCRRVRPKRRRSIPFVATSTSDSTSGDTTTKDAVFFGDQASDQALRVSAPSPTRAKRCKVAWREEGRVVRDAVSADVHDMSWGLRRLLRARREAVVLAHESSTGTALSDNASGAHRYIVRPVLRDDGVVSASDYVFEDLDE